MTSSLNTDVNYNVKVKDNDKGRINSTDLLHAVDVDWLFSETGRIYLDALFLNRERRMFGLLEEPNIKNCSAPSIFSFKVVVLGIPGVGKTSVVSKLLGSTVPLVHHETTGIHTHTLFWPVRLLQHNGKTALMRLRIWDVGDRVIDKYEHILESCKDGIQVIIYVFSFNDRSSFDALFTLMNRIPVEGNDIVRVVLGTKIDLSISQVTERDMADFSATYQIPILRITSLGSYSIQANMNSPVGLREHKLAKAKEVAPVLNKLCDQIAERFLPATRKLEK